MKKRYLGSTVGKAFLIAAVTFLAGQAHAAVITDNVTFSITNFVSALGGPVPTDPVTGSFTISLDPTQTYTDDTADIALTSLNIALGSALSFDYSPTGNSNGLAGQLVVGGIDNSAALVQYAPSTDDFYMHIDSFTTKPTFTNFGYSQTSAGASNFYYIASTAGSSVSVSPAINAVPEPTSWALLITGFTMVGFALRRNKAAARISYS